MRSYQNVTCLGQHTQGHVLTSCQALSPAYTKRHDDVVKHIATVLRSLEISDEVIANISARPNRAPLGTTVQHRFPDIIMRNVQPGTDVIFEVGVSANTHKRLWQLRKEKYNTYYPLITQMRRSLERRVRFAVIPVGALGLIIRRTHEDIVIALKGLLPRTEGITSRMLQGVSMCTARGSLRILGIDSLARARSSRSGH